MKSRLAAMAVLLFVGCGGSEEVKVEPVDCARSAVVLQERFEQDTTLPRGCYLAQKTPVIAAAVRLTIEPGVVIVFSEDVAFDFSGDQVLVASGTAEEPILLTGAVPTRGFWKGVKLDGNQSPDTRFDHVIIEYAGDTTADSDAAALKLVADSRGVHAVITNTTLRQSAGWGLWLAGSAVVSEFAGNTLTANALGPASVDGKVAGVLDVASTWTGNDRDLIEVRAYKLDTAATWSVTSVPYLLDSSLSLDAELTIAAGATLVMKAGTGLDVSGDAAALVAVGTAEKPILFTGETKQRGSWEGLRFDGSMNPKNRLSWVTVEYGGSTTSDRNNAAVKLTADSHGVQLAMTDSRLVESQGFGLYLAGSAVVPELSNNTFSRNALGPAFVVSTAAHLLPVSSAYTGNDVDAVAVDSRYTGADVTWHAIGVPYVLNSNLEVVGTWTLAPGVTVVMTAPEYCVTVSGPDNRIQAVGTAEKPIVFTGATKSPGSWGTIFFNNTTLETDNVLDYVTIEYGGGATAKGLYGEIVSSSDSRGSKFAMTHSTVRQSATYGVWLDKSAQVGDLESAAMGNTFEGNASGNVFIKP